MGRNEPMVSQRIRDRIHTIRGIQVMIDTDLADLYGVEVKRLNEQVKRNSERFPVHFCFRLSKEERDALGPAGAAPGPDRLRSQIATLKNGRGKHRKYPSYVFTEQGVAMLSAVLRSQTAVRTSIQIINAFVAMRRFITANARIFQRIDTVERRQIEYKIETDEKFKKVFNALESREIRPRQGIFFDGHAVYHLGASLKDLGRKWFAFSKMDIGAVEMLGKLEGMEDTKDMKGR